MKSVLFGLALVAATSFAHAGPKVSLETSAGQIVLELDADKAPESTRNFLSYVRSGFYDGTVFHRVIAGFMIQGGGFTPGMTRKETAAPIRNEARNGLKNETGTIAMARTSDPNSATSQFFINVADNAALDYPSPDGHGYAVFGKVVDGMEVVMRIAKMPTTRSGYHQDVPAQDVLILKARETAATKTTD
jgi:peptidyl-prolyl cis-trans isomerase A (cyclophilin A)